MEHNHPILGKLSARILSFPKKTVIPSPLTLPHNPSKISTRLSPTTRKSLERLRAKSLTIAKCHNWRERSHSPDVYWRRRHTPFQINGRAQKLKRKEGRNSDLSITSGFPSRIWKAGNPITSTNDRLTAEKTPLLAIKANCEDFAAMADRLGDRTHHPLCALCM
ncbi:hypothetical protein AVEN_81343-1 [Araneus ventricosus]|uniref:Uncharacterized protein n=1 Tax=Araneus ventricosus TaxID=182803 RepID=A0A4Y2B5S9_ARAVE|nr:hypothetical protein AVEN_81343-1 [Araneus ventricosus]